MCKGKPVTGEISAAEARGVAEAVIGALNAEYEEILVPEEMDDGTVRLVPVLEGARWLFAEMVETRKYWIVRKKLSSGETIFGDVALLIDKKTGVTRWSGSALWEFVPLRELGIFGWLLRLHERLSDYEV